MWQDISADAKDNSNDEMIIKVRQQKVVFSQIFKARHEQPRVKI